MLPLIDRAGYISPFEMISDSVILFSNFNFVIISTDHQLHHSSASPMPHPLR